MMILPTWPQEINRAKQESQEQSQANQAPEQ